MCDPYGVSAILDRLRKARRKRPEIQGGVKSYSISFGAFRSAVAGGVLCLHGGTLSAPVRVRNGATMFTVERKEGRVYLTEVTK